MRYRRRIRCGGEEFGFLALQEIGRLRANGDLDQTTEFYSTKRKAWFPIAGLMFDVEPARTVSELKEMRFTHARIIGVGWEGGDCPACVAIHQVYPIDDLPALPPEGCTCVPWCRSVIMMEP